MPKKKVKLWQDCSKNWNPKKNFVYIAILNVLAMRQNYALILLFIS